MPESKHRKKRRRPGPTPPSKPTSSIAKKAPSPTWYVVLMTALMAVGVILVIVRFVFVLDQLYLLVGLGMIAAGFLMTTNYR